ncbi:porin [Cupriavidus basilensis]|uniref:Porin n=1 Tax=Cupriavidus basilensis TaxID=68895 RepID=A0ABT6AP17_9BURK|nr:porin [Cupriavidus basilensis]MDF3834348.1 porin [Cupriavidus basilensis]
MEETLKKMTRNLIAAVAGGLLASAAQAQSSVTMYGVVDAGIEYVSHAGTTGSGSAYRVKSGNSAASRWGLRGKEDLGGGLSAIFVLENGFFVDTGMAAQGGRLFGRKAFVGIAGPWGQITLGRQYNILGDIFIPLDTTRYATYSVLSHDTHFSGIADNTIKYTGNFGNLTLSAMYSAGYDSTISGGSEVPGAPRVGQEIGAGASYTAGRLGMALVYDQRRGTSLATANSVERRYAAGLIYTSGPFIAVAGYRYLQGDLATPGLRSDLYWLGASYSIMPALTLRAGIYRTDRRASDDSATSYTLQAVYSLSKRTDVFLLGSYMDNRGRSKFGVANATTAAPGVGQTGIIAGIKHIF